MITFREITKVDARYTGVHVVLGRELCFDTHHTKKVMEKVRDLYELSPENFTRCYINGTEFIAGRTKGKLVGCYSTEPVFVEGEQEAEFSVFVFSDGDKRGVLMTANIDSDLYQDGRFLYNRIKEHVESYVKNRDYSYIDGVLL